METFLDAIIAMGEPVQTHSLWRQQLHEMPAKAQMGLDWAGLVTSSSAGKLHRE